MCCGLLDAGKSTGRACGRVLFQQKDGNGNGEENGNGKGNRGPSAVEREEWTEQSGQGETEMDRRPERHAGIQTRIDTGADR